MRLTRPVNIIAVHAKVVSSVTWIDFGFPILAVSYTFHSENKAASSQKPPPMGHNPLPEPGIKFSSRTLGQSWMGA